MFYKVEFLCALQVGGCKARLQQSKWQAGRGPPGKICGSFLKHTRFLEGKHRSGTELFRTLENDTQQPHKPTISLFLGHMAAVFSHYSFSISKIEVDISAVKDKHSCAVTIITGTFFVEVFC